MSRRGYCYDNAVAESFFQLLKRERIKHRVYCTRAEARADVFDYIEMFYNARRAVTVTSNAYSRLLQKSTNSVSEHGRENR